MHFDWEVKQIQIPATNLDDLIAGLLKKKQGVVPSEDPPNIDILRYMYIYIYTKHMGSSKYV